MGKISKEEAGKRLDAAIRLQEERASKEKVRADEQLPIVGHEDEEDADRKRKGNS